MSVRLNHTIVWCQDKQASATFLANTLGLAAPQPFGPFLIVEAGNDVSLDYHETDDEIASQHQTLGDQPQRRRTRRLLHRPQRTPPRDHHQAIRERNVSQFRLLIPSAGQTIPLQEGTDRSAGVCTSPH
jgi:catechol 2,3-dioxygenase-like lactoylglutathione lyase family enzyme